MVNISETMMMTLFQYISAERYDISCCLLLTNISHRLPIKTNEVFVACYSETWKLLIVTQKCRAPSPVTQKEAVTHLLLTNIGFIHVFLTNTGVIHLLLASFLLKLYQYLLLIKIQIPMPIPMWYAVSVGVFRPGLPIQILALGGNGPPP